MRTLLIVLNENPSTPPSEECVWRVAEEDLRGFSDFTVPCPADDAHTAHAEPDPAHQRIGYYYDLPRNMTYITLTMNHLGSQDWEKIASNGAKNGWEYAPECEYFNMT